MMQIRRIQPRNRRITGRATGTTFFDLRWPSGRLTKRDVQFQGLKSAIKFLKNRLKNIPESERGSLSATLFAEIRKPLGGMGRSSLSSCVGEHSLPEMFAQAEATWKELDHEEGDHTVYVEDVIDLSK